VRISVYGTEEIRKKGKLNGERERKKDFRADPMLFRIIIIIIIDFHHSTLVNIWISKYDL
jgi:hypothetical protein